MPASATPQFFGGPFGGINDVLSKRQLPTGQCVDALNVVNDFGSIRPRPGYEKARTVSLKFSPRFVYEASLSQCIGLGVDDEYIYYTNTSGNELRRITRDGANKTNIGSITSPTQLAIDEANEIAYVASTTDIIKVTSIKSGTSTSTLLSSGGGNFTYIAIDVANDYIFLWKPASYVIQRATLSTGAGLTTIASLSNPTILRGLVLDTTNQKIFVLDQTANKITRLDYDGSNSTDIATGLDDFYGMAIDVADERLYLTKYDGVDTGNIVSIKTDGTDQTTLITGGLGSTIGPIAFHASSKQLFFSPSSAAEIYRMNSHPSVLRIISMFSLERNLIGVPDGTFGDDWILGQLFNETTNEVDFVSWFPATDESFILSANAYRSAKNFTPFDLIITNDRDTDPDTNAAFQSKFGRADFAYTGESLNTAKGGVLIANGEGQGCWANYVMGNHKIRVTNYAAAGNIRLVINGVTTNALTDTTTQENARIAMQETVGVNQVIVTKTGTAYNSSPVAQFDIEFVGSLAGQAVDVSIVDGTTSAELSTIQAGGTETGHKIFLLPTGLPTPSFGAVSGTFDIEAETTTSGSPSGNLDGVYRYVVTYYSSMLGLESPPSGYLQLGVSLSVSEKVRFDVTGLPDTIYHQGSTSGIPFRLCDRMRIYRQRVGNAFITGTEPDGLGQVDDGYYLITDIDLQTSVENGFTHSGAYNDDGAVATGTRAPNYGYPPEGAQYVTIHDGRAHWLPLVDGIQRVYYSELPNVDTAENGYHYVRSEASATIENARASDHHATSIFSFGGQLILHTNRDAFIINTDLLEFGDYRARRLPGGGGCAGKHTIVETDAMPELSGRLIWPNDRGDIYQFDGGTVQLISRSIRNRVRQLVRKTWQNIDSLETGQDTWYFASAILDPEQARVIYSLFNDDGAASNTPLQLVYSLDSGAWTRWDIPGWGFHLIRELSASTGKGQHLPVFSDASANLFKLEYGKGDNGSPFSWSITFGEESWGTLRTKMMQRVAFAFETIEYGATAVSVAVTANIINEQRTVSVVDAAKDLDNAGLRMLRLDGSDARYMQFILSGTITDDQDHPRLVAREIDIEPVGAI